MAGASLSINVKYDSRDVDRALNRLSMATNDMSPVFQDIGEHLLESTKQRFADQIDPDGLPWEPLDPNTIAGKKRNADKILIESGRLMDSLHPKAGRHGVEFGTNLIYGATHQFGDDERGIPARPFLGVSTDDERAILDIVEDHLLAALRG